MNFNIKAAHKMVREQQAAGNDVSWDGWDIIFFRPADHAMHSPAGAIKNGVWGFNNRVSVNSEGIWEVDERNIRRIPRRYRARR